MAVTLNASDLTQPEGDLAASYFPDGDLDSNLEGWLSRAAVKVTANAAIAATDHNGAAAAWVYYLAYTHIANALGSRPNVVSVGSGEVSRTYAQDRPAYWLARAEAQKSVYDELVVPVVPASVVAASRMSMSIPTTAIW